MTNEQAIEILKNILPAKESYREMIGAPAHCQDMLVWNEPEYYAIEKAIQALEKQIPKKPNKSFNGMESLVVCDCGANAYIFPRSFKGCPYCLQAIDWSMEKCLD